jgi:hypothetical protein
MNVQFLEPARAEFTEAVNYYNAQAEGLGPFIFSYAADPSSEYGCIRTSPGIPNPL